MITNKRFWDALPADVRGQLEQAMKDATRYANDIAKQDNDRALDAVRRSGRSAVFMPAPAERAHLRRVLTRTHAALAGRVGKDLLQSIYREIGFQPEA